MGPPRLGEAGPPRLGEAGPPAGEAGAGLAPSFTGKLAGIGPRAGPGIGPPDDGVACGLAGGILICGLIGLGEFGKSDGLVESAMWSRI